MTSRYLLLCSTAGLLCATAAGNAFAQTGAATAQATAPASTVAPDQGSPAPGNAVRNGADASSIPSGSAGVTPSTTAGEVVVTGERRSLQSAEAIKRASPNIVDSIVAEDIGKFPDNSVADSLQRVTGVQVFRGSPGEVDTVVVRGLPNIITTLNGREIFTGDGRGFAFQDLPSEAVAEVNVYKTSSANLIEGGIAGLINIELRKPLDFNGPVVAGTLRGVYSSFTDRTDPIGSLLLSDRWHTNWGDFGALIDVSYIKQRYDQPAAFDDVRNPVTFNGQTFLAPNVEGALYNQGYRERPEMNVSLQWRPNSNLELYADGLFDRFYDRHELNFFFSAPGSAASASNVTLFPSNLPGACQPVNGAQECELQSGAFVDPYTASSTQAIAQQSYDSQLSAGGKWHMGRLKLSTDVSYTDSEFKEDIFIIDTPLPGQTLQADTNVDGHVVWSLPTGGQSNVNNYTFNGLFQTWDRNHGFEVAYRADGEYDLDIPFLKKIETGFRYAHRLAFADGGTQVSTPPPSTTESVASVFGAQYFQLSPNQLGIAGVSPWYSGNPQYLFQNESKLRSFYGLPTGLAPNDPTREFNAAEDSYAGYIQGAYGFNALSFPIDGLFGVRIVGTNRSISATGVLSGPTGLTYFPVNANTTDLDVLPNASALIHFTPQLQLRLVYARTASRPAFPSLDPSQSLAPPTVNRLGYGSSGNPDLAETKSNSYDASLEWYFSRTGSLTAGLFYRDISGYIETYGVNEIIGGIPYNVSQPESAGSGHLDGAELAYQQFFDFLPGPLSGLGTELNYTYIEGDTQAPASEGGAAVSIPLQNVSKNNGNAVLIYEKYGFSGRLAYNYRGAFINAFNVGGTQQPQTEGFKPERHLDLSVSQDIGKHFVLTADATNLTGNKLHEYLGTTLLPQDIRYEDRTYSLGVRFRF